MAVTLVLLLLLLTLSDYSCLQWSSGPQDNAVMYACAQGTLSLPWTLSVSQGDTIENIQWFYSGRSQEMIATHAHGLFFAAPTFSGRVQQTTNAGIDIELMQTLERGNYSVEVLGREAGGDLVTLWRSAILDVTDDLQISGGQLHVTQQPMAEYDNLTDQYHVVLRCGTFTFSTLPPFEVIWSTPSGQTVSSSSYHDGSFHLMLSNPVEGGSYTCRVPPASACLHGNTGEATVVVEKMEARLIVMEARQTFLESKNNALESKNNALEIQVNLLENKNNALETQVNLLENKNNALESKNNALEIQVNLLENKNKEVEDEVNKLKGLSEKRVSFHARMISNTQLSTSGLPVIMSTVINDEGHAYNSTSGVFTAPFNGFYYFIASTEATCFSPKYAEMALMVDDTEVDYVFSYCDSHYDAGSVHAVVHLMARQTVWLKNEDDSHYFGRSSAFSGFLLHPDP